MYGIFTYIWVIFWKTLGNILYVDHMGMIFSNNICMCVYIYMCIYMCIYIYICTFVHIYIYIHIRRLYDVCWSKFQFLLQTTWFNCQDYRYIEILNIACIICICHYRSVCVCMYHDPVQCTVLTCFNYMVQIGATSTICMHHITTGNKQHTIVTRRNIHDIY